MLLPLYFALTTLVVSAEPLGNVPASSAGSAPPGHHPISTKAQTVWLHQQTNASLLADLQKFQWVRVPNDHFDPLAPKCGWRHPSLDELVKRAQQDADDRAEILANLKRLIESNDRAGRIHAAMALARLERPHPDCVKTLDQTIFDEEIPLPVRTAAVYELARFADRLDAEGLRALFRQWAKLDSAARSGSDDSASPTRRFPQGQAMAEAVLYVLIRHELSKSDYNPEEDRLVQDSIEHGPPGLQRIAAIAYSGRGWEAPPASLVRLLGSESVLVRRTALAAICGRPTPAAATACLAATSDQELDVRLDAVRLLSRFPGEASSRRLSRLLRDDSAAVRQAAVESAADLRELELVRRGADDAAQRVRVAVARRLLSLGVAIDDADFQRLLADRDPMVQEAAIESLGAMSREASGPVLFEMLTSPSLRVRQAAQKTLVQFWRPASTFTPSAPPELRAELLRTLQEQWPYGTTKTAQATHAPKSSDKELDRELAQMLERWPETGTEERRQIANKLVALGPSLSPKLDQFFQSRRAYPTSDFIELVLAKLDPDMAAAAELARVESGIAVQQATRWKRALATSELSYLKAVLLAQSLRKRTEPAVWLALAPVLESAHPTVAAFLDQHGLTHPSRLVRKDCWQRVAARVQSWHEPFLCEALKDESSEVRVAALDAAGFLKSASIVELLAEALRSADVWQRLAAARALYRQGDARGAKELDRLSFDDNPHVRLAICRLLSEGADPALALRILHRCLDDPKPEIQKAAIQTLEQTTGVSFSTNRFSEPLSLSEQTQKWRDALKGEFQRQLQAN